MMKICILNQLYDSTLKKRELIVGRNLFQEGALTTQLGSIADIHLTDRQNEGI